MSVKEIIKKCSELSVYEQRVIKDDYAELVFFSKDAIAWEKNIVEALGPAIKSAEAKPTKNALDLTKDHGGIWDNQTLFGKEFNGFSIVAMFCPWQDETHTTLKIICLKR